VGKKVKVNLLVDAGKVTPGPPVGPALGPFGLRIDQVVREINEKTKEFEGMKVPVTIIIDMENRTFELEIGTPPTSSLILREIGVEKGSGASGTNVVGDLSLDQVVKIAKIKLSSSFASSLVSCVKEVLGTCKSMGVTVEGKDPVEVIRDINSGRIKIEEG